MLYSADRQLSSRVKWRDPSRWEADYTETSRTNYQLTMRDIPEGRRSHLTVWAQPAMLIEDITGKGNVR